MKTVIITTLILLAISTNAYTYQLRYTDAGAEIKWGVGEITIHLDSSLELLDDNAYDIVEESFLQWSDHIDSDIIFNFVYENCSPWEYNCVRYSPQDNICHEGSEGCAYGEWYVYTGYITNYNITFNAVDRDSFKSVALHEIGHFFGLMHSENSNAVMYYLQKNTTELHRDDINGIKTLYSVDGSVYESVDEEIPDVFSACSVANLGTNSIVGTLWSLIF